MELNPILRREIRARWRRWPTFIVVFGYAICLTSAVGWIYAQNTDTFLALYAIGQRNAAALGHHLFFTLTWLQTLGWMLLAPLLTATAIAGERESGTLALLQLTPFSALRIITGKLLSALSFLTLMLLVPLPTISICFLLGGVSPGEFGAALLLHLVTAITGALIGLNCSAWSRRASISVRATITSMILLNLGGLYFSVFLHDLHPLLAARDIFDTDPEWPLWLISVAGQMTLSVFLFGNAAYALMRPQDDQLSSVTALPSEPYSNGTLNSSHDVTPESAPIRIESAPDVIYTGGQNPYPYVRWWQMPPTAQWQFENPVLQREVRRKFRIRQESAYGQFDAVPASLVGPFFFYLSYLLFIWAIEFFVPDARADIWWVHLYLALLGLLLAAATLGALSFVQERESGLLEPLLLTSLSPREVITGKLLAPLLACGYYALPLIPVMLPCFNPFGAQDTITLNQAFTSILIVGALVWLYTSVGLFISWFSRNVAIAVCWTFAVCFLHTISILLLPTETRFWHPIGAFAIIHQEREFYPLLAGSLPGLLTFFGIGCLLLALLQYVMRHGIREK